jgi:hypothetical protein
VTIQVDFGQATSVWKKSSQQLLRDENGKAIKFNSMIDAMNYFGVQGWEFVQAYVVTEGTLGGQQNVYHWLLKKELTAEELELRDTDLSTGAEAE